eukprot:COSAG01_NODE_1465_length_10223_cov_4.478961_4_plen_396_part_00
MHGPNGGGPGSHAGGPPAGVVVVACCCLLDFRAAAALPPSVRPSNLPFGQARSPAAALRHPSGTSHPRLWLLLLLLQSEPGGSHRCASVAAGHSSGGKGTGRATGPCPTIQPLAAVPRPRLRLMMSRRCCWLALYVVGILLVQQATEVDAAKKKKKKKKARGFSSGFANKGRVDSGLVKEISPASQQLFAEIEEGDMAAVKELLGQGADPAAIWETPSCQRAPCQPLHAAVLSAAGAGEGGGGSMRAEMVAVLTAAGAPLNGLDKKMRTPLHLAAAAGWSDVTSQLLELGASTELTNQAGATPLYLATTEGHLACVDALLAKGADPNTANTKGQSVLFNAVFWNQPEIATKLIAAGADVTKPNAKGKTLREKLDGLADADHRRALEELISAKEEL